MFVLGSIKHSGTYGKEYNDRMTESGNSSKWAILALIFFLAIHLLKKQINKNAT